MMRIAILSLEFPPYILGGSGLSIVKIIPEIALNGFEVHLLIPGTGKKYHYEEHKNIHFHFLPFKPAFGSRTLSYWASLPYWYRIISKEWNGFDLVHSNGLADLTLIRSFNTSPRVVTAHHLASSVVRILKPTIWERLIHPGNEIGLVPYLEPVSMRRADWIISVSENTKMDLIASLGIDQRKIRVIHHGTDLDGYQFLAQEIADLRADLGIGNLPMILFVGRLEPRKGINDLLNAFSRLSNELPAMLVLVGSGNKTKYVNLAKRLGIEEKIIFIGYLPSLTSLKKMYAACDIVVLPSLFEGLGLVALEARAAGKFTVAYRVGGIPEVVTNDSGYLVTPGDYNELSQAMTKALRESHTNIPKPYSWSAAGQLYCNFYNEILYKKNQ